MKSQIILEVGVKIFLKDNHGRYLILRRSRIKYPKIKNFWDIPGGRIIPGLSLFENLRREVSEETGLNISGRPKLISAQDIIRKGEKHIVRLTFLSFRKISGIPILNDEHLEFRWCALEEMLQMKHLDEFTRAVIKDGIVR